ncbi:MAG TPA: DUF481 domain-containing protein, partial [Tepidisphaeraceae bacterium]|nr:DUF481 domain-containing protein [Tepidisphaeraceae bacterium]
SLRSTTSGGLGYYIVKTEKNSIDLRAGPAFVWEKLFNGETHADASGLAGLRAVHTINDHVNLSQEILYTVAFSDTNRYQITGETALNVKLPEVARGMGLKLAFRDDYDNGTSAPRKNNDTRLTLAMTLDF